MRGLGWNGERIFNCWLLQLYFGSSETGGAPTRLITSHNTIWTNIGVEGKEYKQSLLAIRNGDKGLDYLAQENFWQPRYFWLQGDSCCCIIWIQFVKNWVQGSSRPLIWRFRGGNPSRSSLSFIHNFGKTNQINTKRDQPQNTDEAEANFRHSILQMAKLQGIWIKLWNLHNTIYCNQLINLFLNIL